MKSTLLCALPLVLALSACLEPVESHDSSTPTASPAPTSRPSVEPTSGQASEPSADPVAADPVDGVPEARPAPRFENVDAKAAAELLASGVVIVLDVRTPGEYGKGHLKGAINIDFMGDDFKGALADLDRTKTYLMHCQSGGRSGKALAVFKELGFQHIAHLDVGYGGWVAADNPVVK